MRQSRERVDLGDLGKWSGMEWKRYQQKPQTVTADRSKTQERSLTFLEYEALTDFCRLRKGCV